MIYYKQCLLLNKMPPLKNYVEHSAYRVQVAYIPEEFAVVGEAIRIHGEDGWVVHSVGARKSHDEIVKLERLWTKNRKHSDI